MKRIACLLLALALVLSPSLKSVAASGREMREVAMAESAIFWSLLASASSAGRTACSLNQFACSDDRAELGLSLLGAKSSPVATEALTGLLRYRIDGGLSEDFTCYVLKKKDTAKSSLLRLKSEALRERCEQEVASHAAQQPELFRDVNVGLICASTADLDAKRRSLIALLAKGKQCAIDDF